MADRDGLQLLLLAPLSKVAGDGGAGERRWIKRTPAQAAGLTDHRWSLYELLVFAVPPTPPKRRGRRPRPTSQEAPGGCTRPRAIWLGASSSPACSNVRRGLLFTGVRGRGILGTSPLRSSRKFASPRSYAEQRSYLHGRKSATVRKKPITILEGRLPYSSVARL